MVEAKQKKQIAVISSHTQSLFWFRLPMMQEFLRLGYDVIAVGSDPEAEWQTRFQELGIHYKQIPVERNGLNPFHDWKTLRRLYSFIKKDKPDVIFCYQAKTVIYSCIAAGWNRMDRVYPLIAGLGSIFRANSWKSRLVRIIMSIEYKIALRYSKRVMFQNRDDSSEFINAGILPAEKCTIINGSGVDTAAFSVLPQPGRTAFLMIGRLIKDKGLLEYLEACRIIKKTNPNVSCLLVGPFDSNPSAMKPDELQRYIDDGTIEYFGEQEDVRPYIAQASVFVLPSYHEGTPKTVLESMACGRAIITTNAPGCRETVDDGVNGYLVPVQNAEAVAEKMQVFLDQPALAVQMGAAGRALAVEKYDIHKVNASIVHIMELEREQ